MRLLIFLPTILIPAWASSSPTFCMMCFAYMINKQSDTIQPWHTPFLIWTLFIFLALEIYISRFTALPRYFIFTNWEFIITLHWTILWAPIFKNSIWSFHVSASPFGNSQCMSNFFTIVIVSLVICNISVTAMTCWSLLCWLVFFSAMHCFWIKFCILFSQT